MSPQSLIDENKAEWLSEVRHYLLTHDEDATRKWIVEGLKYLGRDYHGREYPAWECESAADQLIDEVMENAISESDDAGTQRTPAADATASGGVRGYPSVVAYPQTPSDVGRIS